MRAVVQRVAEASVRVDGRVVGAIGPGLLVLLGVARTDGPPAAAALAARTVNLRIFPDGAGQMNRSVRDAQGAVLVVSQFTLMGDARKGRRPSYVDAAPPAEAEALYREFIAQVEACGLAVAQGVFRADMAVHLVNDGPVTILLDSQGAF